MPPTRRNFLQALSGVACGIVPATLPALRHGSLFAPGSAPRLNSPVLLNRNENPYGPSEHVQEALREAFTGANRYPKTSEQLTKQLAVAHRVHPERVLLGCGSTEILRVLAATLLGPGKNVITASPTFEVISEYAQVNGAQSIAVPLNHEFAHDLEAIRARVDRSTALIYICNPNNPTASLTPRKSLEQFLIQLPPTVYVVVDEAYHHFVPRSSMYISFLEEPVNDDRLIVLRTFSNAYGLAGLRIGYAVTAPELAAQLRLHTTAMGVSEIGLRAALAALEDLEGLQKIIKQNADTRQEFFNQAMARMLKPIDSKANFVMMDTHHRAEDIVEHFRKHEVLIGGPFPRMDTHICVSYGAPEEMNAFWRVWDKIPNVSEMKM